MKNLAQLLASALKQAPSEADSRVPESAAPAAIALLEQTIRVRARARRRNKPIIALAAAAALLAGFFGTAVLLRAPYEGLEVEAAHLALVTRGDLSEAVVRGGRVGVGSRIQTTAGGTARMRFQTGSQIWLDQKSALELTSAGADQTIHLSAGRVLSHVTPLRGGQRFRVVTPDTELEVRGTRFSVEWLGVAGCAGQPATRVAVEEGAVWVRHANVETIIRAGEIWPPACPIAENLPTNLPAVVSLPARPRPITSRLAEENRRFGEVLQARQAGRHEDALGLLEALRRDFPRGQLEEDVAAEELRITAGRDPARAQRAARAYLKRFPQGYARALAEELASPSP